MAAKKQRQGICAVHKLLDGDTDKRTVKYCSVCKKWICLECWPKYGRRAKAAIINLKK